MDQSTPFGMSEPKYTLTGVPDELIYRAREGWGKDNFIRRLLIEANERKIKTAHTELESCAYEETPKIQGRIKGLREAIASINEIELKPH